MHASASSSTVGVSTSTPVSVHMCAQQWAQGSCGELCARACASLRIVGVSASTPFSLHINLTLTKTK